MLTQIVYEIALCLLLAISLSAIVYARQHCIASLALVVLSTAIYAAYSELPLLLHILLWVLLAIAIVFFAAKEVRKIFVSSKIRDFIRRALPPISNTEREAIEAGTVWWEAELFSGQPDWKKLLEAEAPQLTEQEEAFLNEKTGQLCEMINDWEVTSKDYDLSEEVWQYIRKERFFGMVIPQEYGGLGFSAYAHARVVQKIASRSITAAVTVMVPNSLGPGMLILEYGTDEQKQHYLPRLANGEEIPCFALTSAQAGSDAAGMPDTGVVCRGEFEGKEVLGVRLNWSKRYITLAPVATVVGLAFKLQDPEGLIGEEEHLGITLALIPAQTPGVEIGRRHMALNIPFMNGPIRGKDVFIPMDWLIGGQKYVGQGWRMLMECLSEGRAISLPALSVAAAKYCCFSTGAYARVRKQFKRPISDFEGVAEGLAEIAGNAYLMTAVSGVTAASIDAGEKPAVASAISKFHLTEKMRSVVNLAMDIHGGSGICVGPRNQIARMYQSIPIAITVEGANILTRSMIIFGQGAIRCHPWLYKEMQAAQDLEKYSLDDFDELFVNHAQSLLQNVTGTWLLALSNGRLAKKIPSFSPVKEHLRTISRLSAAFALVADYALLKLGGEFKRKEYLSGLLGDMLSELYMASATIKHFCNEGNLPEQKLMLDWTVHECTNRFHQAMLNVLDNLPGAPTRLLLRFLIYPYGKPNMSRDEKMVRAVADAICEMSPLRKQLVDGVFVSSDPNDPLTQIDHAMAQVVAAHLPEKKLYKIQREKQLGDLGFEDLLEVVRKEKLMSPEEIALIEQAHTIRLKVIEVDEFSKAFWQVSRSAND